MNNERVDSHGVKNGRDIAAAVVIGLALGISPLDEFTAVPLFEFAALLREFGLLEISQFGIVICFLRYGVSRLLVLAASLRILLMWLARYSAVGAFYPQMILNGFLVIALYELSERRSKLYASIGFSAIFLLAGIQKINPLYLTGIEFTSAQGYGAVYQFFLGPLPEWLARDLLPSMSIVLELVLGVGLLWWPTLFAHIATLFVLVIAVLHPPVLYVYFTALLFVALIDEHFVSKASPVCLPSIYRHPFFWAVASSLLALNMTYKGFSSWTYFLQPALLAGALLYIHLKRIRQVIKLKSEPVWQAGFGPFPSSEILSIVVLGAFCLSFVAFKFGAPTPVGFSMFSAQNKRRPNYGVEISSRATCDHLLRQLVVFDYTDAGVTSSRFGCKIMAPTASGRSSVVRQLCHLNPNLSFRYFDGEESDGGQRTCSSWN
ncbi:MAG: hypothetical protein JNJ49_09735 [Bdellovibrionaceae bacterium]|nr:hypothetical protein [Pseudobdellovibrionaceae bacterium]